MAKIYLFQRTQNRGENGERPVKGEVGEKIRVVMYRHHYVVWNGLSADQADQNVAIYTCVGKNRNWVPL